uniref:Uncharacterized protein n=1 Tax=Mycobacterium phage Farewell TaxID=3158893 RepID=A0AAU8GL70_9CAUD
MMVTKRERARIRAVAEARHRQELEGTGHIASARATLARMFIGGHFDPPPRPLWRQVFSRRDGRAELVVA